MTWWVVPCLRPRSKTAKPWATKASVPTQPLDRWVAPTLFLKIALLTYNSHTVVGWKMTPSYHLPRYQILILWTYKWYLIWKQGLYRCNKVKDLEMGRLSWIIRVSPKCSHVYPGQREIWHTLMLCDGGAERDSEMLADWSNADHKLRKTSSPQKLEEARNGFFLDPPEGAWRCQHLARDPWHWVDFWPREPWENEFLLF